MQTTSATYDRILAGTDCSYEAQLVIDDVGTFGESDLMSISTSIEMFQEDPDIGKAIASEINVVMLNPVLPIPTMAILRPQVKAKGIAPKSSKVTIVDEDLASEYATYSSENITFSAASGATVVSESLTFAVDSTEYLESEWIAQGIFYIDTREVTANNNGLDILTIHGFDAMLKTEQMYSSNATVGDALDILYVQTIADAIGVEVDPRTWGIMGSGYMIPFPVGYSMREILGYIASAYAGCFIISDTGQLRLVALEDIEDETRYLIDEIGEIIVFGVDSPEETVTASGAVATFTAGGEYALDELEIAIEPVQDLHGQDAPYPAGAVNLFDTDTFEVVGGKYIDASGNIQNNTYMKYCATYIGVTASTAYYISCKKLNTNEGSVSVAFYNSSKTFISRSLVVQPTSVQSTIGATFTTPSNTAFIRFNTPAQSNETQVIKGSTAPDKYYSYSNICPISGWTGCDIWQSHGNLFDASTSTTNRYLDTNGTLRNSTVSCVTAHIPVSSLKEYYLDTPNYDGNARNIGFYHNDTWLGYVQYNSVPYTIHPIIGATSMRVTYLKGSSTYIADASCLQVSWLGNNLINQDGTNTSNGYVHKAYINASGTVSTAQGYWDVLEYVPINPSTTYTLSGTSTTNANGYAEYDSGKTLVAHGIVTSLPFTLTTGANTRYVRFNRQYSTDTQVMLNKGSTALPFEQYNAIYKGTLNVKTGVLTADYAMKDFGTLGWVKAGAFRGFVATSNIPDDWAVVASTDVIDAISDYYKAVSYNTVSTTTVTAMSARSPGGSGTNKGLAIQDQSLDSYYDSFDASAFASAVSGRHILYRMTTPQTYQLTPTQVQTLVGQNNLWANTGNIINLEFVEPASEAVRILV